MIGVFALGVVLGAALVVLVVEFVLRPANERLQVILKSACEEAKREAKVYRNLLFPVMAKVEGAAAVGESSSLGVGGTLPAKAAPSSLRQPLLNRRIPFRIRLRMGVKALNSKQQATDALASALQKQPSGEKAHA